MFVTLRPTDRGCLAFSERKRERKGGRKRRDTVSRDHWLCGIGTEGLADFDLEEDR